ncbi:MAG: collagen-like protein [Alphaproteobacteria bacterium]|nr:collagen-like protein [Alphaproteobacteria bacterium]MBN2675139.1 collagen-like protein [Alphaproteobacteria bacterium]
MKRSVNISLLSIVCALCTVTLFDAQAASSVRSFGGSGTYNGTSSAIAARTGSLRSASIRANSNTVSSDNNTSSESNNSVRTASNSATSRLSVGKYLSGAKSVNGGSSIRPLSPSYTGTSTSTGTTTVIQNQVDELERRVDTLQDSTDNLVNTKQDILTAGAGIEIANGVISAIDVDGRTVLLQSDGTSIQWKYDDETSEWTDLVLLEDLRGPQGLDGLQGEMGPQGPQGIQGEPGVSADMENYSTTTDMNAAIITAINAASVNYATAEQGAKADTALQSADLSNYALVDDVNTALTTKANTADLGTLASKNAVETTDVVDANITKPKLAPDVQTSLDLADTALQSADMSDYALVDDVNVALTEKANVIDVNTALTTKANTADLGTLASKNAVETADVVDANITKTKLAPDVQTSLELADTALQPGDVPDTSGAPDDGSDYVLVMNNGQETWFKVAY